MTNTAWQTRDWVQRKNPLFNLSFQIPITPLIPMTIKTMMMMMFILRETMIYFSEMEHRLETNQNHNQKMFLIIIIIIIVENEVVHNRQQRRRWEEEIIILLLGRADYLQETRPRQHQLMMPRIIKIIILQLQLLHNKKLNKKKKMNWKWPFSLHRRLGCNSRIVVIPNSNHSPFLQVWERLVYLMIHWLNFGTR